MIFGLSREQPPHIERLQAKSDFRIRSAGEIGPAWENLPDPGLLIFPGHRGFSGKAWLTVPRMRHSPPEWVEPGFYLGLQRGFLLDTLDLFLQTNRIRHLQVVRKPAIPPVDPLRPAPPETSPRSILKVHGDLAGRSLLNVPELPSIPHNDALKPSTIEIGISPEGYVFSQRFVETSGNRAADKAALQIARGLRFKPTPKSSLAGSGKLLYVRLEFLWHTISTPEIVEQ